MRVLVASIINQIRQNLRDRYKSGFPIIKELIQNADDAYASRIDLVFVPGIPEAKHPLLQGPALVILNDGTFDEKNARALNCIGLSSKAGNPNAVGRYGLGLKSVFHLCEAFFFLSNIEPALHIVNPYAEMDGPDREIDKKYPEWNSLSTDDYNMVFAGLQPVLKTYPRFLCIWIPLRKMSHFDRRHPIIPEFPGEKWDEVEKILTPTGSQSVGLANELGRLFPQLRSLENLSVLRLQDSKKLEILLELKLGEGSARMAFPAENIEPNKPRKFNGNLSLQRLDGKNAGIDYAGVEKCLDLLVFQSLNGSTLWPKHSNEDPETFELIEQKDNAQPHIAAIFSRFPVSTKGGMLGISRAVFLPLEKQYELVNMSGSRSYGLTLHGWFFVDAGRTELPGWDWDYQLPLETSEDLTLSWNGALAQLGTLQAVIPALEHFTANLNLSLSDVFNLTTGLQSADLYRRYKQYICERDQWLFSYDPKGSKWLRTSASQRVMVFPKPPESDFDRPGKMFPGIASKGLVTMDGMPRLSMETEDNSLTLDDLVPLLITMPVQEVFSNQGMLEYLVKVLEKASHDPELKPVNNNQRFIELQLKICREAFANLELKKLDENRSLVKRICGLIPSQYRFSIQGNDEDLRKPDSLLVLKNLFQQNIGLLITPANFDNSTLNATQRISISDAEVILKAISEDTGFAEPSKSEDIRSRIALQVFGSFQEPFALMNRCGNLPLFKGTRYVEGSPQDITFSYAELRTLNREDLLFHYSTEGARGDKFHRDLSLAFEGANPVIIRREIKEGLKLPTPDSSPIGCIALLGTTPKLSRPEQRRELARHLIGCVDTNLDSTQRTKLVSSLRFVLHGMPNQYNYPGFLYTQEGENKISKILANLILEKKQEGWMILDPEFGQILTRDMLQKLRITELGDTSALSLLRSHNPEERKHLDFSELSSPDRNKIIFFLYQHEMNDILLDLSIHETQAGNLVYITPQTFLESSFVIPAELANDAVLLRSSNDPILPPIYNKLGVKLLSADSTIQLAVNKAQPEKFWLTIMNALPGMDVEEGSNTLKLLREKFWLPTLKDGGVSPNQILHIPGMEPEIAILLAELKSEFVGFSDLLREFVNHPAWKLLCQTVIPDNRTIVKRLGRLISQSEKYCIGSLDSVIINETFAMVFRYTFEQSKGMDVLPIIPILQKIEDLLGIGAAEDLLKSVSKAISPDRLANVFNHISAANDAAPKDKKDSVLGLFDRYLGYISDQTELREIILLKIQLMNQNRKWKPASNLAYRARGIDPEDLLDNRQGQILKLPLTVNVSFEQSVSSVANASLYEQDLRSGAKILLANFQEWEPFIQNKEVLGGFLCLLGDQFELRERAKKYLGIRDIDETREILKWDHTETFRTGENVKSRLHRQAFFIRIVEPQYLFKNSWIPK